MALVNDAISSSPDVFNAKTYFSKDRINENLLKDIMYDLEETDIISVIFLMTDENTNISEVNEILKTDCFIKFISLKNEKNWEEKLLEILIITGNINIIRKLGFNKTEIDAMRKRFVCSEHNVSVNLNRVIKSLFHLCKSLDRNQVKKLINVVNNDLREPIPYDDKIILELYVLNWIQQKYITIDNPNLNNLLKNLKTINCLYDLPFNFDYWEAKNKIKKDSLQVLENDNSLQFISCNKTSNESNNNSKVPWPKEHKRLCIIVNEVNFAKKYKIRDGSDKDKNRLKKTFEGLKFTIQSHRNLSSNQMLLLLNSLNEPPYNEYGCIFMCILSHGAKGEIVFSDAENIPIETIKMKFCCKNLQDTLKFVIIQACQGKQIGQIKSKLVADGLEIPSTQNMNVNPLYYKHFGLFKSTIENFTAMRHEAEGSWFIQDLCDELEHSTPIDIIDWTRNVLKRVSERRDKIENENTNNKQKVEIDVVQLPEITNTIVDSYVLPKYQNVC